MRRRALITSLAGAVVAAPAAGEQSKPCRIPTGPRDGYFPNVVLTSHEGEKARFYDDLMRGRIVVVNFMYTTCDGRCPLYTTNL
jgi:protein SCO1/2